MDALSILHVTAPGRVGGLESVVRGLATGHAARGHRLSVFASTQDPADHPLLRSVREAGVQVYLPGRSSRNYLRERAAIRDAIRDSGAMIVHTHGYRSDVVGLAAAVGRSVKTVTTAHGFTGGGWKNRVYERFQLRAFRKFDAVVSVSRPLSQRITASGVAERRVRLIPNAFRGTGVVSPATARKALGLDGERFVVGWVGRVTREKGLDVMLDALRQLRDLPLLLVVIGEGRERDMLERGARQSGLENRIRWLGMVPDGARYFSAFDLFGLSSRTEGTPITVLEAMEAGVPIVTTAVGGIPDMVSEQEAWLVPAENPSALALAIREAWSRPDTRQARAGAARRRLESQFAVEPWLDRYEALYRELLASGRQS
jgi:glycosyltransferase involved in cell wall biosynthesis